MLVMFPQSGTVTVCTKDSRQSSHAGTEKPIRKIYHGPPAPERHFQLIYPPLLLTLMYSGVEINLKAFTSSSAVYVLTYEATWMRLTKVFLPHLSLFSLVFQLFTVSP